jgi:hypothetical protein
MKARAPARHTIRTKLLSASPSIDKMMPCLVESPDMRKHQQRAHGQIQSASDDLRWDHHEALTGKAFSDSWLPHSNQDSYEENPCFSKDLLWRR